MDISVIVNLSAITDLAEAKKRNAQLFESFKLAEIHFNHFTYISTPLLSKIRNYFLYTYTKHFVAIFNIS